MKKLILASIGIISLLLLNGCSSDGNDKNTPSPTSASNSGIVSILGKNSFDWGDINIEGGDVEHVFTLKNVGDEDLVVKSANTTCMCTTAFVETKDGSKSPAFGMHGNIQWNQTIKPGEEFDVRVIFDPMAHGPTATGPIQRSVFLLTSSKPNAEFAQLLPEAAPDAVTELKVRGDVLSKAEYDAKTSSNTEEKISFSNISPLELKSMLLDKDFFLLDVHIPEQEHIDGTDEFIDFRTVKDNLDKLPQDKDAKIVVYCRSGSMSQQVSTELTEMGYTNVFNLEGGRNAFISLPE